MTSAEFETATQQTSGFIFRAFRETATRVGYFLLARANIPLNTPSRIPSCWEAKFHTHKNQQVLP